MGKLKIFLELHISSINVHHHSSFLYFNDVLFICVSLLKNTYCFLKYPKISISNIKIDGQDSNLSLLIGNAINMLLNDRMSEKISNIITTEIKRKLKSI